MQKEFRNSQFINIYFHKFAPSRLPPPCRPPSFLSGPPPALRRPVSPPIPAASGQLGPQRLGLILGRRRARAFASPAPLAPPVLSAARVSPACARVCSLGSLSLSLGLGCLAPVSGPGLSMPGPQLPPASPRPGGQVGSGGLEGSGVVSPATGGRLAEPRGLRIYRAVGGGGERPEPRPGPALCPAAGWVAPGVGFPRHADLAEGLDWERRGCAAAAGSQSANQLIDGAVRSTEQGRLLAQVVVYDS